MPCVFLGSFLGVMLGKAIGQLAQICIFGITVAWSIQTTSKKAFELLEKERDADKNKDSINENSTLITSAGIQEEEDQSIESITPELKDIKYQEKYHFTAQRCSFILLNFCCLFATQFLYGGKGSVKLPDWGR